MWSSSALGGSQALPVEDRLCIASAFSPGTLLAPSGTLPSEVGQMRCVLLAGRFLHSRGS